LSRKGNPSSKEGDGRAAGLAPADLARRVAVTASTVVALGAFGCSRGCGRERPYTPYAIDVSPPSSALAIPPPDASFPLRALGGDAGGFVHVVAQRPDLPDGAFRIEGAVQISPPPGEAFMLVFAADLDDDNVRDAVAWVTSTDPLAGRLLFYKGGAAGVPPALPKQLAALPAGQIGQPGCAPELALEQIGPHTAAVSVHAACNPTLPVTRKVRWVAVAAPLRDPALREELLFADPLAGERLGLELDASDIDGDARDDLVARVSIEGAPAPFEAGPHLTADLRWFDRPTGLSRDADEPEGSLRRAAAAELARASKKTEAPSVSASSRQLGRLYAWLCSDSGESLVSVSSGGIRCGASRALEDASAATIRAALALGDVPRAVLGFEHIGWRPAANTKQRRSELEKAILKAAPARVPSVTRVFATAPDFDPSGAPGWGPLTFTPGSDLLVRTRGGLAMANLSTGAEGIAQGIPSWPSAVTNLDTTVRWLGLYDPCDGTSLRIRFGTANDPVFVVAPAGPPPPGGRDLPVPVPAPIPSRCATGAQAVRLDAVPGAWAALGLEAWMAGEPVAVNADLGGARPLGELGALGQPVHAGSPRSPDGRSIVVGTKLGALVRSGKSWQLWRPADLEGSYAYADLRACAVSNDARAVACVRDGHLIGMLAP
jgi:hypothetical protein